MSEKMTCPGCTSHTSDILRAYEDDQPCPVCGLSASAAGEILAVRTRRGDEQTRAQLTETLVKLGRAETERDRLKRKLDRVTYALEGALKDDDEQ